MRQIFQNISCYCLSRFRGRIFSGKFVFQNISCYCLSKRKIAIIPISHISKHLMLLFIFAFLSYSSYFLQHFKTSHVIVYPIPEGSGAWIFYNFKTSHVIVYRAYAHEERKSKPISKHLMLLFITSSRSQIRLRSSFQNISCYCLSAPMPPLKAPVIHFKTSHVIVYQVEIRGNVGHVLFQNISCYCLSISQPSEVRAVILFQNISCYCLSALGGCWLRGSYISKHLMLLFITMLNMNSWLVVYFKTSHVIVYRF